MLEIKRKPLSRYRIAERMRELGISQKSMIAELKNRGIDVCQPNFSAYIRGNNLEPKADKVCEITDKILKEVENGSK